MATPLDMLHAAVEAIKAELTGLATCAAYAGEFSGGELQRASVPAPAVLTACLGGERHEDVDDGGVDWLYRFVAYCMVRNAIGRTQRSTGALALASAVVPVVDGSRFGLSGVLPAKATRIDNLYSEGWDKASVSLWAVTWEQKARIFAEDRTSGMAPEEIYLGMAPKIGADHEDDYIKVWPAGEESV